ncbi:hypothetical protein ACN6LA_003743 [Streptomyces sp. SAS_269]
MEATIATAVTTATTAIAVTALARVIEQVVVEPQDNRTRRVESHE